MARQHTLTLFRDLVFQLFVKCRLLQQIKFNNPHGEMFTKDYFGKWYCVSEMFHDNHNMFSRSVFTMTVMLQIL